MSCKFFVKFIFSLLIVTISASAFSFFSEAADSEHVKVRLEKQHPAVLPASSSALSINFTLDKGWHYYASGKTAPGGTNLKITSSASKDFVKFAEPIFPPSHLYVDKMLGEKVDVYDGSFTIYLPFQVANTAIADSGAESVGIKVEIDGAICSGELCAIPKIEPLTARIKIGKDANMADAAFKLPARQAQTNQPEAVKNQFSRNLNFASVWAAIGLSFLAGVILNIMPCVLPVIPLKVLSIFEQAKHNKARCAAMGISFCLGILLFFAGIAVLNIVLRTGYSQAFQWGQHFREPNFLVAMSLLMAALAAFMFGVFTITVPSAVAGRSGSGEGLAGSVAMGFLAAILSTPCSFAILTAAFAWAQTQNLFLSTVAIMTIGVGMAAPYAILTSMPAVLKYLPRAGRWTEIFKQTMGFVLLIVAGWLITILPRDRQADVLYYSVILVFCLWMWGGWVTFTTGRLRKYIVRFIAAASALFFAFVFLSAPAPSLIDWRPYDASVIETAKKQNTPVLIDFTADWCLTCKAIEKTVYSSKKIAGLIKQKGILAIKGDTTLKDSAATIDLSKVYNEPGVPVTILFLPGKDEPVRLAGLEIRKLQEILETIPGGSDERQKK